MLLPLFLLHFQSKSGAENPLNRNWTNEKSDRLNFYNRWRRTCFSLIYQQISNDYVVLPREEQRRRWQRLRSRRRRFCLKEEEKNIQKVFTFSLAGAKCRNQTIIFVLNQILSAQVFSRKSFKTLGKILFLIACPSTRNCVSISNCSHSNLENVSFISRETSSFQDSMIPDFLMSLLHTMFWAYKIQLHPLAVNKRERKKWFW